MTTLSRSYRLDVVISYHYRGSSKSNECVLSVVKGRIFLSGAFQVQFRDFFITDLLCSMTYMFVSLQTLVCSALHDVDSLAERCELSNSWIVPFMTAFPAFWRLLQCLRRYHDHRLMHPHLTNATKYSLQLAVIFISAVARITDSVVARVFWIIFAVAASLFAHFWDVSFDWGLSQKNKVNKYLRKVIIYPRWLYIVAIGLNFLLRLSWVFLLSPNNWGLFHDARLVVYLQAQVEMFRRFIWSIIRMENEHLNNVGKFRAITEVPLPFRVNMLPPEDVELPIRRPSLPLASSPSRSRRGSVP
ncbi:EXS family-domain-containing protein [Gaertneriomyces semiglobifer]|nr:EXS family-domain-containing protein [Gaertneriomyces semiglobifer]